MATPEQHLQPALRAVTLASRLCRSVQARLDQVRAITKDDKSPVTVADFASQAVICHTLRQALGPVPIVGEESSAFLREDAHAAHRRAAIDAAREVWPGVAEDQFLDAIDAGAADPPADGGDFWTLDPIDGTKGFLRGQQYAVSLSLISAGRPVLGVLGCPNLALDHTAPIDGLTPQGTLFWAIAGQGAFESVLSDTSARRRLGPPGPLPSPLRLCSSVEEAHTKGDTVAEVLQHAAHTFIPLRLDGQGKYAVVARGQGDAYLRLPSKKGYIERIWDHAAGVIIAQEAGRIVTDALGHPLDFSRGRGLDVNRGIVAAHPALHPALIASIRDLGLADPPSAAPNA
ncbi:MAG: 3'(2'),5'-bisphosphate nucleotidase [Phycisphaerales bacterium]|nr:3'(2'),5'-bisphosphate nucleotidase [Phycisphaerales bacterium]